MLYFFVWVPIMVLVLADVISGGPEKFKSLHKVFWVLIILFVPLIGSILWFLVGRNYHPNDNLGAFTRGSLYSEPHKQRFDDSLSQTERELAALDREIENNERDARIRALEEQLKLKRAQPRD